MFAMTPTPCSSPATVPRRSVWCATGLACVLAWAPLAASALETLNLGHQFARDSIPDRAAHKFAVLLGASSKGRLAVAVHPAATFGDEREHLALLRKGTLDFTVAGDLIISSLSDKYRVVNMPFLYRDVQHALSVYDGALGVAIRSELQARGLIALSWHHVGNRLLTANRPIRNLDDLADLNLRLPQDAAWIATWRALGAQPRQVQFSDLPTALKLGQVEAQENPPNFIRAGKLYEHQKYIMLTHHMPQRQFIFASEKTLKALAPDLRAKVHDAAREASRWATSIAETDNRLDLAWLIQEGGMTPIEFDRQGIAQRLAPVPLSLAGPAGVAVYNTIKAMP